MPEPIGRVLLRFAPAIYGPTVLFIIGEGAVIPLIPVIAAHLGADVALATLIAAMLVIGQLCGNLPAGWAVARFGERRTMAVSGTIALAGALGVALAPSLFVLALAGLLIGVCASAFGIARHAFMTTRVPFAYRARSLSLLGGAFRLGMFVGPFIAALLLTMTGAATSVGWFFAATLVLTVALVLVAPDPELAAGTASSSRAGVGSGDGLPATVSGTTEPAGSGPAVFDTDTAGHPIGAGVFRTMLHFRGVLARIGLSAASLSALRSARQVIIPVWGIAIGADAGTIALVAGISGACDFALFYASGQIMDRFGRLWAVLPAMILMSGGLIALAATATLPETLGWFVALSAVLGAGNGLSSGILMTLGADLAPQRDPAPFLGSWHTISDTGSAAAPVMIAAITSVASLPVAAAAMGVIGLIGAVGFLRWIPRYAPRGRR